MFIYEFVLSLSLLFNIAFIPDAMKQRKINLMNSRRDGTLCMTGIYLCSLSCTQKEQQDQPATLRRKLMRFQTPIRWENQEVDSHTVCACVTVSMHVHVFCSP